MSRRDEIDLDNALDALDVIPAMLRRAYTDVLAPRTIRNEIRAPGISHTMPLPSDREGWATYRWACDQLLKAMQTLAPTFRLAPEVLDTWPPAPGRAALLVSAIRAYLPADKPSVTRRACGAIIPIHGKLLHVTGTVRAPAPPRCESQGCTERQEHGRRCWRCVNYKRNHGEYPTISHATG